MFGMSLATFTQFHVIISLIAIMSGIVSAFGMLGARRMPGMTAVFLITTAATSITGFMFPTPFDAADVIGILSLVLLALALVALYGNKLAGAWRGTYVVGAIFALYLNCFVLVVQSFQKISFLHALAPTQKEPPFAVAQGVLLILFIGLSVAAFRKFRPIARAPILA
ncbi:MAG TPA: hypothetical protein VHW71_10145 [Steroidobacteraceae bacterium]|nr:hypothetical protein [Steroidobacteraceae bacterium]